MQKNIQLSIPTPCHENWDAMDAAEKGRFCGSCQKKVIDFSNMSDRDIAQFFKKPSTGSVCGRFNDDQLDREIAVPRKRIPWLRYFFQIAIPALLFSKVSGQTGKPAKMDRVMDNDSMRVKAGHELKILGMILPTQILPEEKKPEPVVKPVDYLTSIKGRVVNEKGEPVAYAKLNTGEKTTAIADGNGMFCISVNKLEKGNMILVSSPGYRDENVMIDKEDAVDAEFFIHMKQSADKQQPLNGKMGGLKVERNLEPRLFGRRLNSR